MSSDRLVRERQLHELVARNDRPRAWHWSRFARHGPHRL
jgi:hypothetical protein